MKNSWLYNVGLVILLLVVLGILIALPPHTSMKGLSPFDTRARMHDGDNLVLYVYYSKTRGIVDFNYKDGVVTASDGILYHESHPVNGLEPVVFSMGLGRKVTFRRDGPDVIASWSYPDRVKP